jgi:hypothetical protein
MGPSKSREHTCNPEQCHGTDSKLDIISDFMLPDFRCKGCYTSFTRCRLCGVEYYSMGGWSPYGHSYDLLSHFATEHHLLDYLERNPYGGGKFRGCNRHGYKCAKFSEFMKQNPHLIFMDSDYKMKNDNSCRNIIEYVLRANYSCVWCGFEYETFPSFHAAIDHLNMCLPPLPEIST